MTQFLTERQLNLISNAATKRSYIDPERGFAVIPLWELDRVLYRYSKERPPMGAKQRGESISVAHHYRLDNADPEQRKQVAEHLQKYHLDPAIQEKRRVTFVANEYRGAKNWNSKPCVCLTTGTEYSCIREAAELTGIPQSSISAVLNGHQSTAHSLRFAFVTKEENRVNSANRKSASRQFDGGIFDEQNGEES